MKNLSRKSILILFHLIIFLFIILAFFKFPEEIITLKKEIYFFIQNPSVDSNIDFSDYPAPPPKQELNGIRLTI